MVGIGGSVVRAVVVGLGLGLVLAAAQLPAAGSAEAAARICPNTFGGDLIRAQNVACPRARQVVRRWGRKVQRGGRVNRRVLGFRCRGRVDQFEGLVVTCRRGGGKRIEFYANVPSAGASHG